MKLEDLTISIKVDTTEYEKALEKLKVAMTMKALEIKVNKQAERIKALEHFIVTIL